MLSLCCCYKPSTSQSDEIVIKLIVTASQECASCSVGSIVTHQPRFFTKDLQRIHKKQSEKLSNAREKILLKRAFLTLMMISTPLKSMMPDRPDTTRTINIMSGPNYRTDRTHPFRGVLVSGANWVAHRYTELYFGIL
jgi:hypothetical protein